MRRRSAEIFRFEYSPSTGVPHRIRVISTSDPDTLRRVTEKRTADGWRVVSSEEIDYFEFSDQQADIIP